MFFFLILPVVTLTVIAHRCLWLYAPSNVLIARLGATPPRWRTAGASLTVAAGLATCAHVLDNAITAGAPGWLNVAALILTWDAIKLAWFALAIAAGRARHAVAPGPRRTLVILEPGRRDRVWEIGPAVLPRAGVSTTASTGGE